MDRKILCIFIAQALICQVFTANLLHPMLQQYILSSLGQSSSHHPSVAVSKQSPYNTQSLASLANLIGSQSLQSLPLKTQVTPSSLLSSISESGNPNLGSLVALSALLGAQSSQTPVRANTAVSTVPSEPTYSPPSSADASLLNNLAIALQLLLVSNMINTPQPELAPEPVVVPGYSIYESKEPVTPISVSYAHSSQPAVTAAIQPKQNVYETANPNYNYYESSQSYAPQMPNANYVGSSSFTPNANYVGSSGFAPNANFVGSSGFAESNPFGGTIPAPSSSRGGFSLMSPYEALSPSSPYLDPILSSPFGSVMTSKKDFQSPYSSIMAADNKDLFSFSDFF